MWEQRKQRQVQRFAQSHAASGAHSETRVRSVRLRSLCCPSSASLLTKWRKGGAADSKESSVCGGAVGNIAKELGDHAVKGFDRI